MSAERYSQEQILCGLRICCEEQFGWDPLDDPDTRLDDAFKDYGFCDKIGLEGSAIILDQQTEAASCSMP